MARFHTRLITWRSWSSTLQARYQMSYKDPVKQRAYQLDRYKRLRQKWLEANGPCALCRSPRNLTVDHKDPTTKIDHKVWSWSLARRTEELAKCRVLCRDCHRKKSAGEVVRGSEVGSSKLNEAQVLEIRNKRNKGSLLEELAREYKVHKSTISRSARGIQWKHVKAG